MARQIDAFRSIQMVGNGWPPFNLLLENIHRARMVYWYVPLRNYTGTS
jgi:hypothetical protein